MKSLLLTTLSLFFFSSFINGQSKKELIASLNKHVDSLEIVISKQNITINQQNSYQIELRNNLTTNIEKIDSLVIQIYLYKEKLDSLNNSIEKSFVDKRDKKTYRTINIGNQTWMVENLAYYTGRGCWAYNDNCQDVDIYGYLYNWKTAKNVCPSGWHLPSKNELETLLNNVGGSGSKAYNSLVTHGNSGFSALFGGWGGDKLYYVGECGRFWSSTGHDEDRTWSLGLYSVEDHETNGKEAYIDVGHPSAGFSVRCIKDKKIN